MTPLWYFSERPELRSHVPLPGGLLSSRKPVLARKYQSGAVPPHSKRTRSSAILSDMVILRLPLLFACALLFATARADEPKPRLLPIPDKLVVLTFDDSVKSHFTVARPILKHHGFGATFFITEGFTFLKNKRDYLTWDEIRQMHEDGFEIGNHTVSHLSITPRSLPRLERELSGIDDRCREHGIPAPTSFAWPGNALTPEALPELRKHGLRFARRGGEPENDYGPGKGCAYEPGKDHPLLIPSAGDARPHWTLKDFREAVAHARDGKIAVLQFHGVPEAEHSWVDTPRERFEEFMQYLKDEQFTVIAVRDLAKYVDFEQLPADPYAIMEARKRDKPSQ